jgi:RNA polymerase sigma factor (sigma-70 family)
MSGNTPINLTLADTEIIQKILGGEKLLFELLMRRNNAALYKIGRAYGFNHEDTEDLMQDAHITAYLNLSKFENRSQYKTWLIKIMLNKCLYKTSKLEHKNRQNSIENVPANAKPMFTSSENNDTEKQVLNQELSHALEKSIEEIPVEYRTVFILREKEGFSVAETSEVLDISESNVKVRLNRAKAMLRQKIEHYYSNTPVYEFNLVYCDKIVKNVFIALENGK